MTIGGSRVVSALLKTVAENGRGQNKAFRFRVIYVIPGSQFDAGMETYSAEFQPEGLDTVKELRALGVPVAVIPESAVAYSMGKVDIVVVGAEGVVLNGGIISRMGTYQMGVMAQEIGKPFYVVAESHKFVRLYPLGQYDLPFEQEVIQFKTDDDVRKKNSSSSQSSESQRWAVDYTPPKLISAIITESGVLTPSAVSEELIKIWF